MPKKKVNDEEIKELVKDEELCESDDCNCDCEECDFSYDFAVEHKKGSFANIFSIVSKVLAIIYFIVGTWNSVNQFIYYKNTYPDLGTEFYIEYITSFFSTVIFTTIIFVAIGEVVNLINRIKESLY